MLHRSTGLLHRQIRARRRFTAVLRQSRLRTTRAGPLTRFDLDQKRLQNFGAVSDSTFIQVSTLQRWESKHGIRPQSAKIEAGAKSERG